MDDRHQPPNWSYNPSARDQRLPIAALAPAVLGYADPAETNDRIVGPLVATTAIIAYEGIAVTNSTLGGVLIAGFALVGGAVKARVDGGWSSLWTSEPGNEPGRRE